MAKQIICADELKDPMVREVESKTSGVAGGGTITAHGPGSRPCQWVHRRSKSREVLFGVLLSATLVSAGDLSKYRAFQFGMNLATVAEAGGMRVSDAKVVHQRPALIQELSWRPERLEPAFLADPVTSVELSFYNGELFRMVVAYDRYKTRGMTTEDMVEAISVVYGVAARPPDEKAVGSALQGSMNVVARWEDPQYLSNLLHPADEQVFYLVLSSKRLEALAAPAIVEATQIEAQEAPQKELDLRKKQEEDLLLQIEKTRLANKATFRP